MCPRCNGSILRDYRSNEPPYCLQCGYVLIKTVNVDEGIYNSSNVSWRASEAAAANVKPVDMNDWVE